MRDVPHRWQFILLSASNTALDYFFKYFLTFCHSNFFDQKFDNNLRSASCGLRRLSVKTFCCFNAFGIRDLIAHVFFVFFYLCTRIWLFQHHFNPYFKGKLISSGQGLFVGDFVRVLRSGYHSRFLALVTFWSQILHM